MSGADKTIFVTKSSELIYCGFLPAAVAGCSLVASAGSASGVWTSTAVIFDSAVNLRYIRNSTSFLIKDGSVFLLDGGEHGFERQDEIVIRDGDVIVIEAEVDFANRETRGETCWPAA